MSVDLPPMTDEDRQRVLAFLQEHFSSFAIVAFEGNGDTYHAHSALTDKDRYAIEKLLEDKLNTMSTAKEVWVRNLREDDD